MQLLNKAKWTGPDSVTIPRPRGRPTTPVRRDWREFPIAYADHLRETQRTLPLQLGPMSWNDARFAQRELRYFFRALAARRHDPEASVLYSLSQRLRISCPRVDGNPTQHWVVLKLNPLTP
jgi:hypothetical protein